MTEGAFFVKCNTTQNTLTSESSPPPPLIVVYGSYNHNSTESAEVGGSGASGAASGSGGKVEVVAIGRLHALTDLCGQHTSPVERSS